MFSIEDISAELLQLSQIKISLWCYLKLNAADNFVFM